MIKDHNASRISIWMSEISALGVGDIFSPSNMIGGFKRKERSKRDEHPIKIVEKGR